MSSQLGAAAGLAASRPDDHRPSMLAPALRFASILAQLSPVALAAPGCPRLALAALLVVLGVLSSPGGAAPRQQLRGSASRRP